jgi:hypothetical protein
MILPDLYHFANRVKHSSIRVFVDHAGDNVQQDVLIEFAVF